MLPRSFIILLSLCCLMGCSPIDNKAIDEAITPPIETPETPRQPDFNDLPSDKAGFIAFGAPKVVITETFEEGRNG